MGVLRLVTGRIWLLKTKICACPGHRLGTGQSYVTRQCNAVASMRLGTDLAVVKQQVVELLAILREAFCGEVRGTGR